MDAILQECFELCWLGFVLINIKDWFVSGVNAYPYTESLETSAALVLATMLIACRIGAGAQFRLTLSLLSLLAPLFIIAVAHAKAPIGAIFAVMLTTALLSLFICRSKNRWGRITAAVMICAVMAIILTAFLRDLPRIPLNADVLIGMGLGSETLSTSVMSTQTVVTPIPACRTSIGDICQEEGLLAVFALAVLIVIATAALLVRMQGGQASDGRSRLAPIAGYSLLCGLLVLGCYSPAFLCMRNVAGTCALALSFACIGMGGQPPETRKRQTTRPAPSIVGWASLPVVRSKGLLCTISVLIVTALAGISVTDHALRTAIRPLEGIGHQPAVGVASHILGFTPIANISRPMQDATVAMEDGNFYRHHGIDWSAVHRAMRFDLRLGRIYEGGSTITQELAKNLFLSGDRTLWRKIKEAAIAVEMERLLPKRRILELYLNVIDYGMGQHGVTQAAQNYFHKAPRDLTLPESAILVGIVPDPMQVRLDLDRVTEGEQTALGRVGYFFPGAYPPAAIEVAEAVPLDHLIYPYKDAWDRGATDYIPPVWHRVAFYFFANPDEPTEIINVAPCLKDRTAGFLDEASARYHVTGIDHLGVYNDRPMRQSATILSAHAFGQAIDISGFRFSDGTRISVADHANPAVARRLAPIEALLKKHFDIVVDWRDDPLRHETHFHCEVRGPRSTVPRAP